MGKGMSAYNLAARVSAFDTEQAPPHMCHSIKFWYTIGTAVFNKTSEDHESGARKNVRRLLLWLATSDPPNALFVAEWNGKALRASEVMCA
jgi:hypothetical protein